MPSGPTGSPARNWRTNGFSDPNISSRPPDWTMPPFQSTAMYSPIRRALAMSINVDQIVQAGYGNIVAKANPTGLLPTWSKWIDKAQDEPWVIEHYEKEGAAPQ